MRAVCFLAGCSALVADAQWRGGRFAPTPARRPVPASPSSLDGRVTTTAASGQRPTTGRLRPVPKSAPRPITGDHPGGERTDRRWDLRWRQSANVRESDANADEPLERQVEGSVDRVQRGDRVQPSARQAPAAAAHVNPLRGGSRDVAETRAFVRDRAIGRDHGAAGTRGEVARVGFETPRGQEVDYFAEPFATPEAERGDASRVRNAGPATPSDGPSFGELIRASAQQEISSGGTADDPSAAADDRLPADSRRGEANRELELPAPRRDGVAPSQLERSESPSDLPAAEFDRPDRRPETGDRRPEPGDRRPEPGDAEPRSNPFESDQPDESDPMLIPEPRQRRPDAPQLQFFDEIQPSGGGLSCDEFRDKIRQRTIRQVSLDISPPFRPDILDQAEYEKAKADFDDRQPIRTWRTSDGRELGSGRLRDLAYEKVLVETEYGTTEEFPVNRLSEADLAYISDNWGVPTECVIDQVDHTPRNWSPTTMTWMASNLYHNPLYFEEVNLERYGHTAGPILQPVVSSAHFFANIAVLPYKMGTHLPNECQYALGYYRPGNCAPWILPPVPLSVRGGLTQAAAMTGSFLLIP